MSEGRIDDRFTWGEHIPITCENHPDLRWHTKNIGSIGSRSIFFNGSASNPTGDDFSDPVVIAAKNHAFIGKKVVENGLHPWEAREVDYEKGREVIDFTYAYWLRQLQSAIDRHDRLIRAGIVFECGCPMSDLRILSDEELGRVTT